MRKLTASILSHCKGESKINMDEEHNINPAPEGIGGYIFVSHSHNDLKKVRLIRNYLEDREIEPILFYLHCMKDGSQKDMEDLWNLIKREIDARDWVLYLDSESARKSEWVQNEIEYARQSKEGHIIQIDLNNGLEEIQNRIESVARAMRVYISYCKRDWKLALRLYGENAQGKTNLVEAIWLFSGMKSFRGAKDQELINHGQDFAKLELKYAYSKYKDAFYYPIATEDFNEKRKYYADWPDIASINNQPFLFHDEQDFPEIIQKIRKDLVRRLSE